MATIALIESHALIGLAAQSAKPAISVVNNSHIPVGESQIPGNRLDHYLGSIAGPSVGNISGNFPSTEQTITSLQALVQNIGFITLNTIARHVPENPDRH
jgi:hypothetical protein